MLNATWVLTEAHFEALSPGVQVEVQIDSASFLGYGRIGKDWGLYLVPDLPLGDARREKTPILETGARRRVQAASFVRELWAEALLLSLQRSDIEAAINELGSPSRGNQVGSVPP